MNTEKTIDTAEAMRDPGKAISSLGSVGGAPPASIPIPAEDAPRPESPPEERVLEEPADTATEEGDVPEEEAAPELAAPEGGEA